MEAELRFGIVTGLFYRCAGRPAPRQLDLLNEWFGGLVICEEESDGMAEFDEEEDKVDFRTMSYGIKNRVSIPGDTFSAHRERYVFITITGKKLKVNYALDPKDYENGTIPVETNNSKKFEDLPLTFKIRSDLSYRRALKLVDDVMAKKGITKNS